MFLLIALSVMCGIACFTAIHHIIIALRLKNNLVHYIVIAISFMAIGYIILTYLEYKTPDHHHYLKLLSIQTFLTNFFLVSLLWLITLYTGIVYKKINLLLSIFFLTFPIIRLFSSNNLIYKEIFGMEEHLLPWGEKIWLISGVSSIWANIYYLVFITLYGYLIFIIIKYIRSGEKFKGAILLSGIIIFLLTNINDMLVVSLDFRWLFLSEFGIITILITISIYASNDILSVSMLKENLNQKNLQLNATNEELTAVVEELEAANEEFEAQNNELTRNENEKMAMQHQLFQAQKMEAIGSLAGGLAHDFNNTLLGIIGSFDLLGMLLKKENLEKKSEIEKYLKIGMDASHRSADIIKELMTLSRKGEIKLTPVKISSAIKHVKNICENSFPKYVELQIDDSENEVMIMANIVQIEQVLLNLCVNASHAMTIMRPESQKKGGTLTVTCDIISTRDLIEKKYPSLSQNSSCIKISVSDTGIGIAPELKDRIFEPFFSTKVEWDGSGLGLAMTYSIIEKHNGFIDFYSEQGIGTTFNIYLPMITDSHKIEISTSSNKIFQGKGSILIIDDEKFILEITREILEECGYDVTTESDANEAVAYYTDHSKEIDLVIVDFSMPLMSGLDLFEKLKNINSDVKCILTSGNMDKNIIDKANALGIAEYIHKPYAFEELSEKVFTTITKNNT